MTSFSPFDEAEKDSSSLHKPCIEEENARHAAIVHSSPEAIIVFSAENLTITAWNPAASRLFGYSEQEALGGSVDLLLRDPAVTSSVNMFAHALAGETIQIESGMTRRDGSLVEVAITASRLAAPDGRVLGVTAFLRDITADRQVRAEFQASEARFQAIANSVDQMIWSTRPDGYHDYYNHRWYEFTGVSEGTTDGEAWNGLFHPDDRERAWTIWRHSLATGEPYHIEYRLRHRSGQYRWVIGRARPVRDGAGKIVRWYGTCTDVHDLKRTEAALHASEERFRFALDAAGGIGTWTWDVQNDRVAADVAFATLFGIEPERAEEGLPVTAYIAAIHPDDRRSVRDAIERALASGADYAAEYRVVGLDRKERWVLARGQCSYDAQGNPTSFPGVVIDITDRKRTEHALHTAVERIELALDSGAIMGTWIWDIPTDRFTADERFARSFALDPAQCREGMPLETAAASIHPDDRSRVEQAIAAVMDRGGPYSCEYRVRQCDGTYRWVEASGRCSLDASGRPLRFPGVIIDIEERKRIEDELRRREAEATEASRIFKTVIEAVPALIYVKDSSGRLKIANAPVMKLIGKPWSDVEGRTDLEFLDDKDQAGRIMATDRRIMECGATEELEEIVGYDERGPRVWLSYKTAFRDATGKVVGLVGTSVDLTTRKRAEEDRQLLLHELNHRVKNLFAVAVGMVAMTARTATGIQEMADALTGRLLALARAHELIRPAVTADAAAKEGTGVCELVKAVIAPHLSPDSDALHVEGPMVQVGSGAATSLALTLHELATNAAKYGALSSAEGTLSISWREEDQQLILAWSEGGGPKIQGPPVRQGFGSQLSRMSIASQLGGRISYDWRVDGLSVTCAVPLERLRH